MFNITLYKNNEINYEHNGTYMLSETISCVINRELNGQYKLSLIYPINDNKQISKYIEEQMVLKVNAPNEDQLFRIHTIKKDLYNLTIEAFHISYDMRDIYIDNISTLSKNRTNTIEYLFKNTLNENNFKFDYNNSEDNGDLKDFEVKSNNLLNVLLGDEKEGNIRGVFGECEIDVNNFNVICKDRIGEDRGYLITNNKNLINIDETINSNEIITRIMPEGKLNDNNKGLRLDELYVDSPLIDNYNKVFFAHVIFNEIEFEVLPPEQQDHLYNERKKEAQTKLLKLTKELYDIDNVDKPNFTITVDFEDLQYNYKYKDLKHLYSLNLGDTITIRYDKLNLNINSRVISYEFDCIEDKYINITIGTIMNGIAGAINRANKETKSDSNNNGLLGRVEDLENGFSEIEQKWDKVEFRFGTSNINRIKNGAFLAGLDFWNINNESMFDYKTLKDEDFQTIALKINSTLSYEHKNKGYVLSDEIELKKDKDYTLSFKVKLESNVHSATVSILRKNNKQDIEYIEEFIIDTFTNQDNTVYINEKYFKDFKTNDNSYMRIKVVNNGLIDDTLEDNNNAIFTEFALYEGFGYKGFDYNDALYQGITKIDANGVEVSHTKIKTKTRMSADGFHILDADGNILGSFASDLEYSILYSDFVYASNIKNAIINTKEEWEVGNDYNLDNYRCDNVSKIFNDYNRCAKNRINSPLTININTKIDDYVVIDGFDGSDIIINIKPSAHINGKIEIKDCNSKITITGLKRNYNTHDGGKMYGMIDIINSKNVFIEDLNMDGLKTSYSLLENSIGFTIDSSNVYIKNIDINNYRYGFNISNNSNVGLTNITGSSTYLFTVFNNSHVYIGDSEDNDVITPNHSIFKRISGASTLDLTTINGSLVKKSIGQIPNEEKPKLQKILRLKIAETSKIFHGRLWDMKERKWKEGLEKERFICGNKDGKYYLSVFNLDLGILPQFKSKPFIINNTVLKVRLKVNSYINKPLPLYMFSHNNDFITNDNPLLLFDDFKLIGDVYLSRDNYITLDNDILKNLVNGAYKGLGFGCYDMEEDKTIIIDPKSIELIVSFSVI